jgi:hypothetical protein
MLRSVKGPPASRVHFGLNARDMVQEVPRLPTVPRRRGGSSRPQPSRGAKKSAPSSPVSRQPTWQPPILRHPKSMRANANPQPAPDFSQKRKRSQFKKAAGAYGGNTGSSTSQRPRCAREQVVLKYASRGKLVALRLTCDRHEMDRALLAVYPDRYLPDRSRV